MIIFQLQDWVAVIRDLSKNENMVEIKRIYNHSNYEYPALYDNVALLELGRRITFDYDIVSYYLLFDNELNMKIVRRLPDLS